METVGNTAPLSPNNPQEQDMSKVREIFERAVNAMVEATALAKEVSELRSSVAELKSDIEYVRSRNRELDQMLHDVREQRDHAKAELEKANAERIHAEQDRNSYKATVEHDAVTIKSLSDQLTKARTERDDALLKQMETQEAFDAANAKLAKLREALGIPEAKPESPQPKRRIYEGEAGYDHSKSLNWDDHRESYYIEV